VGYDLNPLYSEGIDGEGITIANATSGGGATASDLVKFEKQFELPSVKLVTVGEPANENVSPDSTGESTLDLDSATSVARNVTFEQVVAKDPNSDSDFDETYSYIVNKLGSTVHVVTTSWGDCEYDMEGTASLTIDEDLFKQAIAEGQYWFSASGDNGTDDCEDGDPGKGKLSVDFPGSSPYVMSVGGTNVKAEISNGAVIKWEGETTWQYANSNGASGGGRSILYAKPSYQAKLTPKDGKRDVPDVAALSDDENDGLWTYWSGGGGLQSGWGGTSEAAPQWSGIFALIEQRYRNEKIVDPHVRLYQLAAESSKEYATIFHDITSGNNGVPKAAEDPYGTFAGYNAAKGFDLTTGLGSYIGYPLVKAY
jgi:kumamolisin